MSDSSALERLSVRGADISPVIVNFLSVGDRAEAYASGYVQHNTLHGNVDSILEHGLVPRYATSIPDEEDVEFARDLMLQSSGYTEERGHRFDTLVAGTKGRREPGVFLSVIGPGSSLRYNRGYGIPESMMVLMTEMGAVMLANGLFDQEIRGRARDIYERYHERLFGENAGIAVLEVDPFSPPVIEQRLGGVGRDIDVPEDLLLGYLPTVGSEAFEGLYVPATIPAEDIRGTNIVAPPFTSLSLCDDITRSRFYSPSP
jgi:hypothetical protein